MIPGTVWNWSHRLPGVCWFHVEGFICFRSLRDCLGSFNKCLEFTTQNSLLFMQIFQWKQIFHTCTRHQGTNNILKLLMHSFLSTSFLTLLSIHGSLSFTILSYGYCNIDELYLLQDCWFRSSSRNYIYKPTVWDFHPLAFLYFPEGYICPHRTKDVGFLKRNPSDIGKIEMESESSGAAQGDWWAKKGQLKH